VTKQHHDLETTSPSHDQTTGQRLGSAAPNFKALARVTKE
jgi:hypothetical protein